MAETKGLPYGCDYAKTSRSICKDANCRSEIEKHHLRMAVRTHSHFSEGLQDNWFHFGCFWKRARQDINEAEIRGFEHLKWSDQERIRERIALKDENPDEIKPTRNAMVEYAKSGKSSCMKCKQTLKSNELRIEFHSSYYHPKCLAEKHTYKKMAEKMDNFDDLDDKDKKILKELFTGPTLTDIKKELAGKDDEMTLKKVKKAELDAPNNEILKKMKNVEKRKEALKKQTDMIWEAREVIEKMLNDDKTLKAQRNKKAFIANLIKKNGGNFYAKRTLDQLVQFLADIVVFGGFDPCPKCRNANFYYSLDRRVYQCAGFGKEGKCVYYSREIKRKPFKAEGIAALSKYDGKQMLPKGRVFSETVEEHVEEDKLIEIASGPTKKIDPSRKRKKEPSGEMKPNGFSVDPYFSHGDQFHVYVDKGGVPYQVLMHKVEPYGDVKFYKMQLLESDYEDEYRLFRRYGIVLTDITKDIVHEFSELEDAIEEFKKVFQEKSGLNWTERKKDVKVDDKYHVVELETNLAGTYGRTTAESEVDENKPSRVSKKVKKEKEEDYGD